ncbi:MAG: adenylate/guanylate cyclase domain-containing protein [Microbacteriaceae bacterium]|nr:adenylate/guanylate cyclase domain-containing protein [Microbacteriaceae bacterium]
MSSGASGESGGEHVAVRARRTAAQLSIKSWLLLMLLVVSIGSNVVGGVLGYLNGTDSLKDAAYDRLIEVRDARARQLVNLLDAVENSLLLASRDSSVSGAEQAFAAALDELDAAGNAQGSSGAPGLTLTPEQNAAVTSYFVNQFAPALAEATGEDVDPASFDPSSRGSRYLLYHYLVALSAPAGDDGQGDDGQGDDDGEGGQTGQTGQGADPSAVNDAGDGSAWSAAHSRYHDYLHRMATLLKFDDLVLIDGDGRVVYTESKGVDLGADLTKGPYSFTGLGITFATAMSTIQGLDTVVFSDFQRYSPALGSPVAWAVVPLAGGASTADGTGESTQGAPVGALAVQLPIARINAIMTGDGKWSDSGLGRTGEAYLAGRSGSEPVPTMRSVSRDLAEDPQAYLQAAVQAGLSEEIAEQAVSSGETLLLQPVDTEAANLALDGQRGTVTSRNYLGSQTIAAYAPFRSHGLKWAIVAEIDAEEALAPVDQFTQRLAISSAIIVAVVSLLSVIFAGLAVRPLRRLRDAARRIAAGEQGVQVEAGESDELADVAAAFNDMSRSLELKAALIDEQRAENDRLLRTLMPETLAKRYREGVRTIVQDHQEVTVMFADIVGFEEFGRSTTSDRALDLLNDIFRAFDEAAEAHGVERVRTTRQGYLASCGLSVPRVDHARRTVELALDMQRIVERFGAQHGADLSVRVGMDTGTVTSGLVGRSHVVYDLWGDAVSLAFRLQGGANEAGVFLTQRVVDKLPDTMPFADSGVVEVSGGYQRVWRLDPKAADAPR